MNHYVIELEENTYVVEYHSKAPNDFVCVAAKDGDQNVITDINCYDINKRGEDDYVINVDYKQWLVRKNELPR